MPRKPAKASLKAQLEEAERKGRLEGYAEGREEGRKEGMDDVLAALTAADPLKLCNYQHKKDPLHTRLNVAMQDAAHQNQIDVVLSLVKAGADPDAGCEDMPTALYCAVKEGHIEMVQALLKAGADPNYKHTDLCGAPLQCAMEQGSIPIVRVLLAAGADVYNGHDPKAGWMIDYRAPGDQVELTRAFVEAGVYMGPYYRHRTALMQAARSGKTEAAAVLIEAGCDVNAETVYGETVLIVAALGNKEGMIDTIQLLLKSGAEINYKNKYGHTALIRAARAGHSEAVRLLLSAGADVFYWAENVLASFLQPVVKAGNAYDLADDEAVKDILKTEMHRRRIAAALSVLPAAMPVEVRQTIVRLCSEH